MPSAQGCLFEQYPRQRPESASVIIKGHFWLLDAADSKTRFDDKDRESYLGLENSVAYPWASTKLRSLKLVIDPGGRIGIVVNIETLDLQGLAREDETDFIAFFRSMCYKRCFPDLLKLGGNMYCKDRRGWLEYWGGLKKLECLLGLFNIAVGEKDCVLGQAEVEWIAMHWPNQRCAEFLLEGEYEHDMSKADWGYDLEDTDEGETDNVGVNGDAEETSEGTKSKVHENDAIEESKIDDGVKGTDDD
ncbi:hypothetical protein BGW39_011138 [Mortierella sp. 14UC]|nr:hypothetical protein BGW39_011138 [Mortierella sp. 14UC]